MATQAPVAAPSPRWKRWLFWALWLSWITLSTLRNGFDIILVVYIAWAAAMYAVFHFAEKRLSYRARLYVWFAQGSATIGLLFGILLQDHTDPTLAVLCWVGISLLGLIWTVYYERFEAR
jgi:FtsH-binding integral membrane protein